jgi:type III pantothenate kinase
MINEYPISSAILSNTSEPAKRLIDYLSDLPFFIHLDHHTPIPVTNQYATPESLGKDRLAAAVGAFYMFPDSDSLVIDMGTCITVNLLKAGGIFVGGNISPGITMRIKAMHHFTAGLPMADIELPEEYFGTSTISALQNGAIKGAFREIEALINEVKAKDESINVILTGGDAQKFESYSKNKIFVSPNLVLEGLNEILKYNVEKI